MTIEVPPNYRTALDIYEEQYGPEHLMTANVLERMAQLYLAQKDLDRADGAMSRSIAIKTRIFGRYHPVLIDGWLTMARLCKLQGQTERCEYYLAKSTETVAMSHNAITLARVYEQVNQIRRSDLLATAF